MGVSVAVGLTGWWVARRVYKRPAAELPVAPVEARWHQVLMNKWYVDECYDAVIIRPLRRLAAFLYETVDAKGIDGLGVHGVARSLGWLGDRLRAFQNGDVQAYVTAVVVGLAAILILI